jgi:hypothetical protein
MVDKVRDEGKGVRIFDGVRVDILVETTNYSLRVLMFK